MHASKVRESLAKVLEAVCERDECIVIVRYGQPLAALVSIGRLDATQRREIGALRAGGRDRTITAKRRRARD